MSEAREVRSFIGRNFLQLKCIISLSTWITVSEVMSLFFATTVVCYSTLWELEFYKFILVHGHGVVLGNYTIYFATMMAGYSTLGFYPMEVMHS